MKTPIRGFDIFSRTNVARDWVIAAWHSPHSLTWRWFVSFSLFRGDECRVRPLWWGYRTNTGLHGGFRLPWIGMVHWQTQHPMWYRDLYMRQQDQASKADYDRYLASAVPAPPPSAIVGDGSRSVH